MALVIRQAVAEVFKVGQCGSDRLQNRSLN